MSGSTKPAPSSALTADSERAALAARDQARRTARGTQALAREAAVLFDLLERLAGEVVLRHVAGRRVLDVGQGAASVTRWVGERAASLEMVQAPPFTEHPVLPFPDACFDVVYCLRTLPYLGHDEHSSVAGARALLAEMGRVLVADGIALVDIDNPRSLRGLVHGVRNPMTVIEPGPLLLTTAHGIERFDTIGRLSELLPNELELVDLHGLLVLTPLPHLLALPMLGRVFARLEWLARDRSLLRNFGAHLLVVLRRKPFRPHE